MKNLQPQFWCHIVALALFSLGAISLQGQSFPAAGLTLPAGKTIVITYEVDVNANACPTGSLPGGSIANQSNVTGTNFATVQTDDPDIVGPSNPTLTTFSSLSIGDLVYKDVNRDGDFDSGTDLGVNGVSVNLYLDNGDGVLTAVDGASIATTATAGGGLYAFTVCPGSYIVEIAASNFNPGGALYDNGLSAALISSPVGGAPDPDNDVNNDDNGDPVSGFGVASAAVTVAYGAEPVTDGDTDNNSNLSVDFGFKTPTTVSINDVTQAEGTGGSTTAFDFTVTRNDNSEAFSLSVNTNPGSATSPDDYTAISGSTISFTAGGSLTQTVTVLVNHDNTVEASENFTVALSGAPAGVTISDASGLGTITNDDAAVVTLSGGVAQNEGTSFVFTATLNNPVQGGFSVAYTTNNGSASTADNDYTDNDGSLTFTGTAGEAKTITVASTIDTKVELNETFTVALGAITGAPAGVTAAGSPQTGTILNDDSAVISIAANVSQSEAVTPQAFSLTISNPVDVPVSVLFNTSDGTATTADNDYTGIAGQTVTFVPGSTTAQTVNVSITNDTKVEADEVFNVTIGSISASGRNVSLGTSTGTGTITNNDSAVLTLSGGGAQNEGNTGTTSYVFTATLTNAVQGGLTANYSTNDGTATTADNDYADNDGSLIFSGTAGETKNITVLVTGDLNIENSESFQSAINSLSGVANPGAVTISGSPQTATITNDEQDWGDAPTAAQSGFAGTYPTLTGVNGARHNLSPGSLRLGAAVDADLDGQPNANATGDGADEDGVTLPASFVLNTTANITVNASGAGNLNAWIDYNRDGDWSDAGEQVFTNTAVTAGNNALSFAVPGAASLGTSYARFRLSSATGTLATGSATDGEVEDYQVTIQNVAISVNDVAITETNSGTVNASFTVSLNNPAPAGGVTFDIATQNNSATTADNDYVAKTLTSQTIPAGSSSYTFDVVVNGDTKVEFNETFFVNITSVTGAGVADAQGQATITNDDAAIVTLSGGIAQNESNAGTVNYIFTATLDNAVQGGFTVPYTTGGGTATVVSDYTDNDGTLTFSGTAGESKTWTVAVNGDVTVELDETFQGALGAVSGAPPGVSTAGSPQTATITNDDAASISIAADVSGSEAVTPQTFSVTLSNPVDVAVSVLFNTNDGSATTADNDYTGISNQTVTFAANTTTAQSVNVAIGNDLKVEANETYTGTISGLAASGRNVSLGTTTRTGTITNDDNSVVTLSGGIAQNEGNSGTTAFVFTATLSNPVQGGFTANYATNDGTATLANSDYTDNDGSLVFAGTAGETKTFTVLVTGDLNIENDETFQTAINSLTGVVNPGAVSIAASPQTATITNDEQDWGDAPGAAQSGFANSYPTLAADNGASHGTAPGALRLGASIDADLNGQPNATATGDGADEDGVTLPSAIVINTNANITVNASAAGVLNAWVDFSRDGDWNDAGEQIFTNQAVVAGNNALNFAVPGTSSLGGSFARFRVSTAPGLSFDGPAADGEVEDYAINIVNTQFSINDPVVTEGNAGTTNLSFTVTRTVNVNACSVDYAITGGTATTADNDYQVLAAGTINFTAGGSFTAPINVVVNGDVKVELNETVDMTLSNPVNASILDGSGTGTITNDDAAVISVNNQTVTEGDVSTTTPMTFTITMSNPSDANVVLNYNTVDGIATLANNDYQTASGTLTFTPGQVSKTVSVTVNGDCAIEPNETFLLRLGSLTNNGRNITLSGGGATTDGTGTINNDDALPVISCPANISKNVDLGVCTTSVTLPLPSTSSICGSSTLEFRYRTVDASNNPTGSYNAYAPSGSNTVVFSRGRYEVEWRITDGSGSSVCSFFVTIIDNQPPSIVCPANQNIPANAGCSGVVGSWNAVSVSDNCTPSGSITVTQTPPSTTVLTGHNSSQVVTLTANDGNGNTANCSFTVTLKDVTAPVAACKNATVNLGANGTVLVPASTVDNGSTDNCTFTLSLSPNVFTCATLGVNTVTLKATDAGGNTATCTAKITIRDLTAPSALCKNPTIFLDNTGQATLSVAQVDNGSSDACGIATMSITQTQFNCSELQGSTWPVTLNLKDVNGNMSSCLAQVTVKDKIAPVAVCEDVTVQLGSNGKATVFGATLAANSTDNCSVWSYSPTAKVYTTANLGVNNLTITVKDYSQNASTCVSQVTVIPFSNTQDFQQNDTGNKGVFDFAVYPNPTSGETNVAFELPMEQAFEIRVFDLAGRMIYNSLNVGTPGVNIQSLRLTGIAAGVYILDFQSDDLKAQKRLIIQE